MEGGGGGGGVMMTFGAMGPKGLRLPCSDAMVAHANCFTKVVRLIKSGGGAG